MTTPASPPRPTGPPPWVRSVVSILETVGFVGAAVFAAIHDGNYALIAGFSGAVMHSVNHQ